MKAKSIFLAFYIGVNLFPAQGFASDRCAEHLTKELREAETVALMHVDIRHHEYVCSRDQTYPDRKGVQAKLDELYKQKTSIIRSAQDLTYDYLGGEQKFNRYYINSANQISFMRLSNVCNRMLEIANKVNRQKIKTIRDMHLAYLPFFQGLEKDFNLAYPNYRFQRLCDSRQKF